MRGWIVLCVATLVSQSVGSQDRGASPGIDEVVVTGERPGPRLWKLTRDAHVLWILATVTPKPRDIIWRSQQVADVLNETQEVIDQQLQGTSWPVNIELDVKSFNPLAGLRASRRAKKQQAALPSVPPLREVLAPDVYARYAKLKARYLPRDTTIDGLRPRPAATRLYNAAINAKGLSTRAIIHDEVHKLARQRSVKVSEIVQEYEFDIDTMVAVSMEFAQIPVADEVPCFIETLEDLENNLPLITERANAWAVGDVDKLRKLPLLRRETCDKAYWAAPRWANLRSDLEAVWLEKIEQAVTRNESTLVMLDAAELLQPGALLDVLGKRGFAIDAP